MTFRINGEIPIKTAKPTLFAPPIVRYPPNPALTVRSLNAQPLGYPFATVGRDEMEQEGFDWYMQFVTGGDASGTIPAYTMTGGALFSYYQDTEVLVSGFTPQRVRAELYDPKSGAWVNYFCYISYPLFDGMKGGYIYRNIRFRLDKLTVTIDG